MKIALAVDLSPESASAAKVAERLVKRLGGTLEVVFVLEPEFWDAGDVGGLMRGIMSADPLGRGPKSLAEDPEICARIEADISEFAEEHLSVPYTCVILEGRADRELSRYAAGHDFLCVGAPLGATTRFALGSVAERLAHRPHTRTLIAKDSGNPDEWVVAVDFSEGEGLFVLEAMRLAKAYGAKVHLLHVMPAPMPPSTDLAAMSISPESLSMKALRDWSEKELARTLEAAKAVEGVAVEAHLRVGYAAMGVEDFVEDTGAGLVVLGTHGRSRLEDALLGSVAWGVVKRMPTSILLMK